MRFIKNTFIENVSGENIEYIVINSEDENILLFESDNKIRIVRLGNEKTMIEKIIELELENDFLSDIAGDQEKEIEELNKKD